MSDSMIDIRHGDNRDLIGPANYLLLCINTVLGVEDAAHGLAKTTITPSYPAIGLRMALGCSTLEGAINALSRLYATASSAVRIQLQTQHDFATITVHVDAANDVDAIQLEENYLIWIFMHCMHFLGRPMPVVGVSMRDPLHFNMGRKHFGIGGPVSHGSLTAFRFSRNLLGLQGANRGGDNVQWECHQLWLDFVNDGPAAQVQSPYLSERGFVRFKDIARQSGISASTMRRRLDPIEGGFRDARQRALVQAATGRLQACDDSVEDVAAELGYSDARSFRRFLKNATGLTPQQLRLRPQTETASEEQRVIQRLKTLSAELNV